MLLLEPFSNNTILHCFRALGTLTGPTSHNQSFVAALVNTSCPCFQGHQSLPQQCPRRPNLQLPTALRCPAQFTNCHPSFISYLLCTCSIPSPGLTLTPAFRLMFKPGLDCSPCRCLMPWRNCFSCSPAYPAPLEEAVLWFLTGVAHDLPTILSLMAPCSLKRCHSSLFTDKILGSSFA